MSVENANPEDFAGSANVEPSYFRIFFGAITSGGSLVYKDQTDQNVGFASDFKNLTTLSYLHDHLNASVSQDGYVSLLAVNSANDDLIYIHEARGDNVADRFADPLDLGKPDGVTGYLDTFLIKGVTGRANVFCTSSAPDNAIWWKYQNANTVKEETTTVVPPGTTDPIEVTAPVAAPPSQIWSDWQRLPGAVSTLTGTQNADGRIILTGLNDNNVPYMNIQSSIRPLLPEDWEGWEDISGGLTGFDQLVCDLGVNDLVHIFASIGSKIYMRVQLQVSVDKFSDWALFASFADPVHTMAIGTASNNALYLVAQVGSGANSPVYAKYQTPEADQQWSSPQIIAHVANDSALFLQPNADTNLDLFALETATGAASYLKQQTLAHWSATWVPLGTDLAAIALTEDVTPNPPS
ncbi:hypothetical protein FGE21_18760 [Phaeobacter sp. B1627]|nr:hypothetical protein FGE21_18760 [Phaeobacter sp. B1627]